MALRSTPSDRGPLPRLHSVARPKPYTPVSRSHHHAPSCFGPPTPCPALPPTRPPSSAATSPLEPFRTLLPRSGSLRHTLPPGTPSRDTFGLAQPTAPPPHSHQRLSPLPPLDSALAPPPAHPSIRGTLWPHPLAPAPPPAPPHPSPPGARTKLWPRPCSLQVPSPRPQPGVPPSPPHPPSPGTLWTRPGFGPAPRPHQQTPSPRPLAPRPRLGPAPRPALPVPASRAHTRQRSSAGFG